MGILLKIAWRNIWRHKGRSFVIGAIILFGAFIMTIGNGVVSGMDRGIQENIVERFSGDITIISTNQDNDNVFGGMALKEVEPLGDYLSVKAALNEYDEVDQFLPVGYGISSIFNESGSMIFTAVLGVDFEEYQKMFKSNINIINGEGFKSGEKGFLLGQISREDFYNREAFWVIPKGYEMKPEHLPEDVKSNYEGLDYRNNLVLMGMGNDTAKDIRMDVDGIIEYKQLDRFFGDISIIDIESYRQCFGYFSASSTVEIPDEYDDIFSSDSETFTSVDISDFEALIEEDEEEEELNVEAGTYNMVFAKFADSVEDRDKALKRLNEYLKEKNLDARAVAWDDAMRSVGQLSGMIRGVLLGFVVFVYFVAGIVIMNTLSMTALERVAEIGMMRAVGAKKQFISFMFLFETLFLAIISGAIGMTIGTISVYVVRAMNLSADNDALQMLFGGDTFQPYIGAGDIVSGILMLAIVVFLSVLYPISVARSITPLEAISRD